VYAVELDTITKAFGPVTAVAELSLAVPRGSIYGFIGPNGSGKTTTLRMILNILRPDRGVIRVFGRDAGSAGADRIGYLPEERGLYKRMKVREVLRFFGELKAGRRLDGEVDAWLEKFGLSDQANKKVEALSKGMSQKVQFIAAVVFRPELLVLDEPFSGLDPVNLEVVRKAVLDLRAQGTTVIFSTHDMNVAETLCDFIFMIFKGRKVLDGTLTSIQDRYGNNTVRVRMDGGGVSLRDLPGVESVRDFGQVQELHLARGGEAQQVLAALVPRGRVLSFAVTRPSLHDIFVRIAAPHEPENHHA
jgi:ABC-2 type transport system ATP-binding protein